MKVLQRSGSRALCAGVVLTMLVAACSSSPKSPTTGASSAAANTASAPGVTATSVLIGSHTPLTGPAAPGYSEIDPAAAAYFAYVNAHGGVYGRSIDFKYLDDAYNPTQTATVVRQLVLQDHIYAMLLGLGTPTHSAVVNFLNQQQVPDLFVASGCACWNNPTQHPYTFGWQLDYVRSGKILGQYVKTHFAGAKVAFFYQNDDFGLGGVQGLEAEIPASMIVAKQSYTPGDLNIGPAVSAIAASHATVVVMYSIPAYTALFKLYSLKVGYNPQFVVNDVGSDPITLEGLLQSFAKQGGATVNGEQLIEGMVTDVYLPSLGELSNPYIALFKRIHDTYDAKAPFDGNVLYGMAAAYTFVAALHAAGRNPTRASIVAAVNSGALNAFDVGLTPYAYSATDHFGLTGAQIGVIHNGVIVPQGPVYVTTSSPTSPITTYTGTQPTPPANGIPGS